ncbi:MAG TPA: helix-turn-helix domain-containing protein [Polyangiaceae bacterium]|nr:helix-turn-helix domain-containing protein [Polyangiaceae bacterium]
MQPLLQPFPFPKGCRAQAWRYQPKYRRPLHFHAEPELNFVWQGRARFVVGGRSFWVERGGLIILPPGIDHALVDASPDLEFFAIGFHPELANSYAQSREASFGFQVACKQVSEPAIERITSICGSLGETPDRAVVESLLREPFEHAALDRGPFGSSLQHAGRSQHDSQSQHGGQSQVARSQSQLALRAASLVQGDRSIRRYEIAKALASNAGDVSRTFRRDTGITLREFRRRVRVLRFLEEADAHPKNLMRAAYASGFGSYSQCHRDFSAVLGVSPREFLASGQRRAMADRFEPATPTVQR